jgi:hypothetical protein
MGILEIATRPVSNVYFKSCSSYILIDKLISELLSDYPFAREFERFEPALVGGVFSD